MKLTLLFLLVFNFSAAFAQESDISIVPLKMIDSTIATDVRYATANNFTHQVLYPTSKVYLRKIVAEKLSQVQKYVEENYGLSLKVFDGYRPLSVQRKLWAIMPDENFVANPAKGSRHNRGAAVDLTLIDSLRAEIPMGTPYDDFTEKTYRDYKDLPDSIKSNRKILEDAMVKFGFEPLRTEWWHFDYQGWKNFSVLDVEIK